MNKLNKLFSICITFRLFLVLLVKYINPLYLPIVGYMALVISSGFLYIYISDSRKTGALGQTAWWDNLRPVHSLLYFLFAICAINKYDKSYILLLIDVIIGLISFLTFHKSNIMLM